MVEFVFGVSLLMCHYIFKIDCKLGSFLRENRHFTKLIVYFTLV